MRVAKQDKEEWHETFVIFPVDTIDGHWVWWETVMCRAVWIGYAPDDMLGHDPYTWQYRLKEK